MLKILFSLGLSALQNKTCTTQNQTLYAELGWPYRLKCQPFVEYLEYQEEEQQVNNLTILIIRFQSLVVLNNKDQLLSWIFG